MKKKVIVVTVHNSENCGSYLQAYAMQKTLQQMGYDVAFLYRDTKGTSHDRKRTWINAWALVKHLHFRDAVARIRQWQTYERLQSRFQTCNIGDNFCNEATSVVLGSDTIWNFGENYFRMTANRLLGTKLKEKQVIGYATSVGNTSAETFRKVADMHGGIDHISTLLVRDSHTQNILKDTYQRESQLVCDPTLLLQSKDYAEISSAPHTHIEHPYLLIYYFGSIPEDIRIAIQQYAQTHQMKIVSLLKRRDWCDAFISSSPCNMVSCFAGASAVVTNTFHGCALSLIYQIPFAAHEEGKVKVKELLNTYESADRLFTVGQNLTTILEQKLNNTELIKSLARQSLERLKLALA
jgi:hypothetical protein